MALAREREIVVLVRPAHKQWHVNQRLAAPPSCVPGIVPMPVILCGVGQLGRDMDGETAEGRRKHTTRAGSVP